MDLRLIALGMALCMSLAAPAIGQTPLGPETGLLLLRNGQVIEGQITRAGDYYVVTQGEGVELRLKALEVEALCGSLNEAYEFKRNHLSGAGAGPHLELAEWCLRHKQNGHCAHELAAAMRIEPNSERLRSLENRLQLATEAAPAFPSKEQSQSMVVSAEKLDQIIRELPKGSVEKFSGSIQPILLNRCGANQCHGPNAKSEFRLLRPPAGQVASRRFTQRNLYAALQYVDPSNPEASPLVIMPQRRHGTALTAVFDKHTQSQLAELVAWSKMAVTTRAAAAPATIGSAPTTLSQQAAPPPNHGVDSIPAQPTPVSGAAEATKSNEPARLPGETSTSGPAQGAPSAFVPRDRFDPEIFNRRYHAGK